MGTGTNQVQKLQVPTTHASGIRTSAVTAGSLRGVRQLQELVQETRLPQVPVQFWVGLGQGKETHRHRLSPTSPFFITGDRRMPCFPIAHATGRVKALRERRNGQCRPKSSFNLQK